LAVQATAGEGRPEIVLFTTLALDRAALNEQLAQAGLSPLHNLRRVLRVAAIPVLGSGKTDFMRAKQLATILL
jgi:long-chain-fatty-acid--[acyl-carrier-protein] ligase